MKTQVPSIGSRVIIHGIFTHIARVVHVRFDSAVHDWVMDVIWSAPNTGEQTGTSSIRAAHENDVWYRYDDKH